MLESSGCHEIHKEVWSEESESFDDGEEPWKRRCSEDGNNTKTPSSPCALSTFLMKDITKMLFALSWECEQTQYLISYMT